MEINKSYIFSASQGKFAGTVLENSYMRLHLGDRKCFCVYKEDNKESLSKLYNQAIDYALKSKDTNCLILVHDDVILEEDPIPKLEKLFDD